MIRTIPLKVAFMIEQGARTTQFEISSRFRTALETRVARLEQDAGFDEAQVEVLCDVDHIRRQLRLVAAQRSEALRIRLFLDRAGTRQPRPYVAL